MHFVQMFQYSGLALFQKAAVIDWFFPRTVTLQFWPAINAGR